MKRRWILVFVILSVPLAVIFVLHIFGENRFDVPVYYTSLKKRPSLCGPTPVPYQIYSDFVKEGMLNIVFTYKDKPTDDQKLQMLRIKDRFNNSPVNTVFITVNGEPVVGYDHLQVILTDYVDITNCQLINEELKDAVLIDGQRRIRGYYYGADREEIDRLAVETEILLDNEEYKSAQEKQL